MKERLIGTSIKRIQCSSMKLSRVQRCLGVRSIAQYEVPSVRFRSVLDASLPSTDGLSSKGRSVANRESCSSIG